MGEAAIESQQMPPVHPAAELFPLIVGDQFAELVSDIAEYGQRVPVVMHRGSILDGRNRWRACAALGIAPVTEEWDAVGSPVAFVLSVNLRRRHLDESQRAMVGARAKPMFEEEARARQGERTDLSANLREGSKAAESAAALVNVSPRSVESAAKVLRDGAPELAKAVDEGSVAVSTAADITALSKEEQAALVAKGEREILEKAKQIRAQRTEARRQERIVKLVEISKGNAALALDKKYPVLYADPPWRYEHAESEARAIENQYPTMSLEEICALPVAELCTEDALLFLWATSPKLEEAFSVLRAWGFTYRTCMVWDKERVGMGYYARQQHELLLIGARGSPPTPPPAARPPSVFREKRAENHSEKPAFFAEMIERMYPELPKLEMFCRSPREGWAAWGNQS